MSYEFACCDYEWVSTSDVGKCRNCGQTWFYLDGKQVRLEQEKLSPIEQRPEPPVECPPPVDSGNWPSTFPKLIHSILAPLAEAGNSEEAAIQHADSWLAKHERKKEGEPAEGLEPLDRPCPMWLELLERAISVLTRIREYENLAEQLQTIRNRFESRVLTGVDFLKELKVCLQSAVPPDGPIETGFRYAGEHYDGLHNKPLRLVKYLWKHYMETCNFCDLAEPVWGDHALKIDASMVASHRRTANNFFKDKKIPFRVKINRRTVRIS